MSSEREILQEQQIQLWKLFEDDLEAPEVKTKVYELLNKIRESYSNLISTNNISTDSYDYLNFCLQYIYLDPDQVFTNLEYEITRVWTSVAANEDFPNELETRLLAAISEKVLNNVFSLQKLVSSFTKDQKHDKAIMYFDVIKDCLNYPGIWDDWARSCAANNDFSSAISVLDNGLKNYSDSQILACNRAYYLYKSRKFNDALVALQNFINKIETSKYTFDGHYIYAINLKSIIYRELQMPLQALIEYSRLSTAGQCQREELIQHSNEIIPNVEALSYG